MNSKQTTVLAAILLIGTFVLIGMGKIKFDEVSHIIGLVIDSGIIAGLAAKGGVWKSTPKK